MLHAGGYQVVGVDPDAPEGTNYRRVEFERSELPRQVDAAVACTSLHHVADPGLVLDKIAQRLAPQGAVIVVEWDWERFDETTALWCFARLGRPEPEGWLHHRRDEWATSGLGWGDYLRTWANQDGLHAGRMLLHELNQRFVQQVCYYGPYFFSDLVGTRETDEQATINAGRIATLSRRDSSQPPE
jgi:SAM-dependent methyltransferase